MWLVKDGVIKEFTVIPDFVTLGYEIMAISCVNKKQVITEPTEKMMKWMKNYPNIVFVAKSEGMGKNGLMISLHKNYTEYAKFVTENLQYWGDELEDYGSMLVSLKGLIVKPFSLAYLAEIVKP